jgi:hypothetical protein
MASSFFSFPLWGVPLINDGEDLLKFYSITSNQMAAMVYWAGLAFRPVNALVPKGRTALHYAAAAGFLEVMTILLDDGANYWIRDQQGETPLALARRYGRIAAGNLLRRTGRQ